MIQEYLDKVKENVLTFLAEEEVSIALFGSVAIATDNYASDIDIAIIPKGKWNRWKLSELRDIIDNLNIPNNVDILDFSIVSDSFKKNALETAIWWRK